MWISDYTTWFLESALGFGLDSRARAFQGAGLGLFQGLGYSRAGGVSGYSWARVSPFQSLGYCRSASGGTAPETTKI